MSPLRLRRLLSIHLMFAISVQVQCNCFIPANPTIPSYPIAATIPHRRCGRSPQPTIRLIPATLCSNGVQHFIRPLSIVQPQQQLTQPTEVKRPARQQQQSAVIQQVTINQNTAINSGLPSLGFGGFKHPFSSPLHHSSHGFGKPNLFGGFLGRTFKHEEPSESAAVSKYPLNYLFSCQPTVREVPCNLNKSC